MYVFLREDEIVSLKVSFTCGVAVCVCDSLRGTRWHIETIISYGAPDSPDLKKKKKQLPIGQDPCPNLTTATFGFQILTRKFGALLIAIRIRTAPAQTTHINN